MQLGSLATENENYLVGADFIGDRADLRFSLVVERNCSEGQIRQVLRGKIIQQAQSH